MLCAMCRRAENRKQGASLLYTLILRGPERRARLLLGVSMVIILSRPLSREPNTFPPLFFFPLSPVTAMSRDRDLDSQQGLFIQSFSDRFHVCTSISKIQLERRCNSVTLRPSPPVLHVNFSLARVPSLSSFSTVWLQPETTYLRSGLKAIISMLGMSLCSAALFLLCSLEALPPPTAQAEGENRHINLTHPPLTRQWASLYSQILSRPTVYFRFRCSKVMLCIFQQRLM